MTIYKCLLHEESKVHDEFYIPSIHLETEDVTDLEKHKREIIATSGEIHIVEVIEGPSNHQEIDFMSIDKAIARGRKL